MVTSFIQEDDFTEDALATISAFLQRFKTDTSQDSVGIVVDGELYYV